MMAAASVAPLLPNRFSHYHHLSRVRMRLRSSSGAKPEETAQISTIKSADASKLPAITTGSSKGRRPEMVGILSSVRQNTSPELIAISMVYFVQGLVSLSTLALSFFLKDELMQGPAQVAVLEGVGVVPWIIKPIYGFASDGFPLFGYRRRSYLMLCGLLGSTAWMLLGTSVASPIGTVAMLILSSVGTACSDVVVDSIVVERAKGEPQETAGSLQSLCWGSRAVGGIISAYFGGYLVQYFGPRFVFRTISIFPLLITLSAFLIRETRIVRSPEIGTEKSPAYFQSLARRPLRIPNSSKTQIWSLWNAFGQKSIYLPSLFMFFYNATPSVGSAMFFFQTNELHFTPEFLGRVSLIGQLASLCGVAVYRFGLRSIPLRKVVKWCCILSTVVGMSQLVLISRVNTQIGLSDQLFILGDTVVLDAIGQVAFMPVLVLAAGVCSDGVEATLFALLMSITNFGGVTGGLIGAGLTRGLGVTESDFTNLGLLKNPIPVPQPRSYDSTGLLNQEGVVYGARYGYQDEDWIYDKQLRELRFLHLENK